MCIRDRMCPGGGGTHSESQHSGSRDRQIFVSSRPAWSIRASTRTGSKATEKPCLKRKKKKKKKKRKRKRRKRRKKKKKQQEQEQQEWKNQMWWYPSTILQFQDSKDNLLGAPRPSSLEYKVQWQKQERPCLRKQGGGREPTPQKLPSFHVSVVSHMHLHSNAQSK